MLGNEPISKYYKDGKLLPYHSMTRLYRTWCGMKTRCYNPKDRKFHCYGGKGITICDEWKNSFVSFAEWAVNNGYEEHLTIDRIDVEKGYEASNCRWVDIKTQENNRTNNHWLTYNGETHTLAEWADITGIRRHTIDQRLKYGWSVEKALTYPLMSKSEAAYIGLKGRWGK